MNLRSFLGLSVAIAKTDFKLKTEGSYLGMLWYLLNPLLMFVLLFLIFSDSIGKGIDHYPLYLLLGIIIYNFFQQATTESAMAIIQNDHLVKSIHFPYASMIGGIVLKTVFSHLFEIFVFVLFLVFFGVSIQWIMVYPLILILLSCFVFGFSLLLSSVAVYFIDLENIWAFLSRLLWFATPIFYSIGDRTRLLYFNLLNPLYYFITASRDILIYQKIPDTLILGGMLVFSLISLLIGLMVFNRLKNKFAELI